MRNIKYRWNKKINFFFKNYKIDFWAYKLQKLNIFSKLNQNYFLRLESRWHGIKFSRFVKQKFLLYNKNYTFDKHKNFFSLDKKKINFFTNFINWKLRSKTFRQLIYNKILQKNRLKEKLFLNLKSNRFRKIFFSQNKFNTKKIIEWKLKKKNYFLINFFKKKFIFNFFKKKIKISKSSRIKNKFIKLKYRYFRKKLKSLFWEASHQIFFADKYGKRYKKKIFVKFKRKRYLYWYNWFIQTLLSCHYGFFSIKKFVFFKKLFFKKKNMHFSFFFFLENTLLLLLSRLNFFTSFRHNYLSIKYGLIIINKNIIKNPYFFVKKNKKISLISFYFKKKLLNLIKDRIFSLNNKNLRTFYTLPKFFEFYLPLFIILKWRDPKKKELKNYLSIGVPKFTFNWL